MVIIFLVLNAYINENELLRIYEVMDELLLNVKFKMVLTKDIHAI